MCGLWTSKQRRAIADSSDAEIGLAMRSLNIYDRDARGQRRQLTSLLWGQIAKLSFHVRIMFFVYCDYGKVTNKYMFNDTFLASWCKTCTKAFLVPE